MPRNTKGNRRERELVNRLDAAGWAVMRAPASGSSTERELPDVLAGNGGAFYAIEAKASKRDTAIYIEDYEVEGLHYFASNFGARARIAVRFDYEDWAFFHADDLHRTPSGKNYRIKHDDVTGPGVTHIEDLWEHDH